MLNLKSMAIMLAAILAGFAFGQKYEWNINQVPDGSITVDGDLNESYWNPVNKIDNTKVLGGVVDGDADCHAMWQGFWDNTGFYLGVWLYDDFHNAPHSMFLADANNAYDDDGLEILIDYSFADAYATWDNNEIGKWWHLVKGFGNDNPMEQYAGTWGTRNGTWYTAYWTVDDQRNMGWTSIFSSSNGVDYQYEARWEWNKEFMAFQSAPSIGQACGLDMHVCDNDGAMTMEGVLGLTEFSHGALGVADHWTKANLIGPAGIAAGPTSLAAAKNLRMPNGTTYDVLGRKTAQNQMGQMRGVRFALESQKQAARAIYLK